MTTEPKETKDNDHTDRIGNEAQHSERVQRRVRNFFASPGVKFVIIGILTIALLIPAMMVWALVEERSRRADTVAASIANGWGSQQLINGPYLVVPYKTSVKSGENMKVVTRYAVISPDTYNLTSGIDVEERKKSIYKTQLYTSEVQISGNFPAPEVETIRENGGAPLLERAFLAIGISDMTGFRSDVIGKIDSDEGLHFSPGMNGLANDPLAPNRRTTSGVHLPIGAEKLQSGFTFDVSLALNGSRHISLMPVGKTSRIDIQSNWPHPGFEGQFLPEKRELTDEGFTATWTIPELARGIETIQYTKQLPSSMSAITVNFVEPLKFYQVTARTLKYSIGFFSLIFLAVFVLELGGKRVIHWIQYLLVGFAMVVFYILLLAFAEQVGFALAYLISSVATTVLIAWYVGDTLGQQRSSVIMGGVLASLFVLMYLIMSEEDYALLAGSITAFLAITATMVATRKVKWSNTPMLVEQSA